MAEPSIDTDKLSYEIFSILESKFLFGYNNIPKQFEPSSSPSIHTSSDCLNSVKNQRGKICILTIDGGGLRNIISGKALSYLEQSLKLKSGNPNARIADYFDVAAGSGIGGVFISMLFATTDRSRPLSNADDTWRFLAEQAPKIFPSSSSPSSPLFKKMLKRRSTTSNVKSATVNMERIMKEKFRNPNTGRTLTLKDTLKPVLIPCYDLSSTAPFVFSRADALENEGYDFNLWQVCRATAAEAGVYEPVSMRSVDGSSSSRCLGIGGGVAMANPTAAAITHVLHNKEEFPFVRGVEDILVISLGSGLVLEGGYGMEEVKGWKGKEWVRPMARIGGDGYGELVDQSVAMAFAHSNCTTNYVRVQANGSNFGRCGPEVDTDSSPNNVKMLVEIGEEMLKQKNVESVLFGGKRISEKSNFEKLDWVAEQLVLEHQRRSSRIAPTVVFKQLAPARQT